MTTREMDKARKLLCHMQVCIRDAVLQARRRQGLALARIAAVTAADTIYQVDKVSEEAIFEWFEQHWPKSWPVELVMEGLEDATEPATFPRGTPPSKTLYKCIIDPIDGTRNLMYDKRSAWVLTGLAPQRGKRNQLGDIMVAVMTEIPTSRQFISDQLSAIRGETLICRRLDVTTGKAKPFTATPSPAKDFRHGFASIVKFFPEGKTLAAQFEETFWARLHGAGQGGSPVVFDDQYISTGGQLYELIAGHDRMIADLRPLFFAKLGLGQELVCHPYDICTALLLEAAGGVIHDGKGRPLRAPLDTTSPVSWVGFANRTLARKAGPVLKKLCDEML